MKVHLNYFIIKYEVLQGTLICRAILLPIILFCIILSKGVEKVCSEFIEIDDGQVLQRRNFDEGQ